MEVDDSLPMCKIFVQKRQYLNTIGKLDSKHKYENPAEI